MSFNKWKPAKGRGSLRDSTHLQTDALHIHHFHARALRDGIRFLGEFRGPEFTGELHLTFSIQDETGTLPISYHGPQPDMLVDAVEAVAIGKYDAAGEVFVAEELLMKCPSKYEEKE